LYQSPIVKQANTTMVRSAVVLKIVGLLFLHSCSSNASGDVRRHLRRSGTRYLAGPAATDTAETITTADCNNIRLGSDYHARLDLYFFYLIEYKTDADLNLRGIGKAIVTELTKELNQCDDLGRPKFAVTIAPSAHALVEGGKFVSRSRHAETNVHIL